MKGKPEEIIPRIVLDKRIEIIVMGTLSRTGVSGLLIGNTAERILTQVDCSVLAVRPEGFVTPVQSAQTGDCREWTICRIPQSR